MRRQSYLLAFLALTGPAVAQADTVYFSKPGANGIQSISGTIVQDTGRFIDIATDDGQKISIPRADVFQVILSSPGQGSSVEPDPFKAIEETHSFSSVVGSDRGAPRSSSAGHYGIKGGMNSSNMNTDPQELEDHDSLRSFSLGAWWGLPLNRRLTFQTEALYSVKGDAESAGGYTASTRMTYLDVPVLAKVGFMHDGPVQPSLFLGPALALNLSAKSTLEGDGNDIEVDVKDQVRPVDVGVVVGGGFNFPLGRHTYGVELRYTRGMINAAGEDANGSARNDVVAIMGSIGLR